MDDAQVLLPADQPGVGLDQAPRAFDQAVVVQVQLETRVLARPQEPPHVLVQAEGLVPEGPGHFSHRGPQDDPQVVDVQMGLGRGDESIVQIDDRFIHGVFLLCGRGGSGGVVPSTPIGCDDGKSKCKMPGAMPDAWSRHA